MRIFGIAIITVFVPLLLINLSQIINIDPELGWRREPWIFWAVNLSGIVGFGIWSAIGRLSGAAAVLAILSVPGILFTACAVSVFDALGQGNTSTWSADGIPFILLAYLPLGFIYLVIGSTTLSKLLKQDG
jgi:hypothetical protein